MGINETQEQATELQPAKELGELEMFVGNWHVTGNNLAGAPLGADTSITGEQIYEWMPGKFFITSRWDRRFADARHVGIGIIGYDIEQEGFFINNYDNLGYARAYKLQASQGVWRYTGRNERAEIFFSADGNSFIENWDISDDGENWEPLCKLRGERVKI